MQSVADVGACLAAAMQLLLTLGRAAVINIRAGGQRKHACSKYCITTVHPARPGLWQQQALVDSCGALLLISQSDIVWRAVICSTSLGLDRLMGTALAGQLMASMLQLLSALQRRRLFIAAVHGAALAETSTSLSAPFPAHLLHCRLHFLPATPCVCLLWFTSMHQQALDTNPLASCERLGICMCFKCAQHVSPNCCRGTPRPSAGRLPGPGPAGLQQRRLQRARL